jgi:hypothetical protein
MIRFGWCIRLRIWWRNQPGRERVAMLLELAILLATTSYVFVAYFQLRDLSNTLTETKNLATTADQQLKFSERPWVGLGPIEITQALAHGKPLKIHAQISNSGKSLAVHASPHSILKPSRLPMEL